MTGAIMTDCEFAHHTVHHADGEGGICTATSNLFSKGGVAHRWPNVDQSPRRSMKPRGPVGVLLLDELLVWLGLVNWTRILVVTG